MSILTCAADCIFNLNGECCRPSLTLSSTLSDFHDPHYAACQYFLPRDTGSDSNAEIALPGRNASLPSRNPL